MILDKIKDLDDCNEGYIPPKDYTIENNVGRFVYNTNAIEGSSLTQDEVNLLLTNYILPNKNINDVLEAIGLAGAFISLYDYIVAKRELVPYTLTQLHKMVFRHSKSFAGKFRGKDCEVCVVNKFGDIIHEGAKAETVKDRIDELLEFYDEQKNTFGNVIKYSPMVLAAIMHNEFESIHPFEDGNGRVGRLLMNYVLLDNHYPPVIIEYLKREEYYKTLFAYEKYGLLKPSIDFIIKEYEAQKLSPI